jgi:hypothetical protein
VPIRRALGAASALAAVATVITLSSVPAGATSCVPIDGASPEEIAAGTDSFDGQFFAHWDFAVIGTTTAIRTDERQGSPTYGATEIDVQVAGILGAPAAPTTITLRAPDPGWMSGYPFEVGVEYFIPVRARTPEGTINSTSLCDPISSLADVDAAAAELGGLAAGSGIPFATPTDDATPPAGGDESGASWFVPVTSALAVGAAAVAVLLLRRRPLRVEPALLAVGDVDQRVEGGGGPP